MVCGVSSALRPAWSNPVDGSPTSSCTNCAGCARDGMGGEPGRAGPATPERERRGRGGAGARWGVEAVDPELAERKAALEHPLHRGRRRVGAAGRVRGEGARARKVRCL
jgi:hypothetical protein